MNRRKEANHSVSVWARLGIFYALCLAAVIFALTLLQGVTFFQLLMIPATIVFANLMEYVIHRFPMHQLPQAIRSMYMSHSGIHHRYFTYKNMEIEKFSDLHEALTNTKVTLRLFAFIVFPLSFLLGLIGVNFGALFFISATCYFMIYELTHLVTHLPESNILTQLPYFKGAYERHRVHHDTKLMHKWNFNVSFPLLDKVFRTLAK
jgi:hypothetical protein